MTNLEKRALARVPLSYETVESFWDGSRSGTAEQCLKALCESHERLRAELEGSEILRADAEKEVVNLKGNTAKAVADEREACVKEIDFMEREHAACQCESNAFKMAAGKIRARK